ncbi:MAG: Glu/Leu/Phe/Val dehydrogenase dimerization domain-containing protein [Gemmatimonadota bacterium]|jgi:glutamate dehydrogenase (NAD(P)+)
MTGKRTGGVGAVAARRVRSEWRRYARFIRLQPELIVAWTDAETGARAWLVMNSCRGGAAGGGTRMRAGLHPREVTYLSKAMELKFALSGPSVGGAKSGIDFDPEDPRRQGVLERWFRAIEPLLRERYGTGGDLNVDERDDVIPTFRRLGLPHPQAGLVRGHFGVDDSGIAAIMDRMDAGVVAPVEPDLGVPGLELTVADMITGFGVAVAVRRLRERQGRSLEGERVLLEGFGNVGAACGLYLARMGARIVGIRDANSMLYAKRGLDATAVEDLFRRRTHKLLPADDPRVRPARGGPGAWPDADVFVCAALSESLATPALDGLAGAGIELIACGANQPFHELKIGSTRVAQQADRRFSVLADIVSNCGMARAFSYLMETGAEPAARPIFAAVEATIADAVDGVIDRAGNGDTGLLEAALGMAMDRIGVR